MTDEKNVAESVVETAPAVEAEGSAPVADDATTLRSRIAGYTAKVNTLSSEKTALQSELAALKARLAEAEAGTLNKDEALRSQVAAKDAEINAVRREAALARIEAKYPETYAVLGDAAADLSPDKLAEAEARFKGVASETTTPPRPLGVNPPKTQGAASGAESTDLDVGGVKIPKSVWDSRPDWLR